MYLFNTISIETGAICNRKCWFCPNAHYTRPDEFMPTPMYTMFLSQLKEMQYKGRIELYMYNEPLRDKRIYDLIAVAREYVPRACLMIATNADYVKTEDDLLNLYKAGLNQLQVNIYSGQKQFDNVSKMLSGIPDGNIYLGCSPKKQVKEITKKWHIPHIQSKGKIGRFELTSRCGLVPELETPIFPLNRTCVRPFRFFQFNWKGEALLCCNDFLHAVKLGSISESTILDIWYNSETLTKYRKLLLANNRKIRLCKKCDYKGGAYTHLIKGQWPELL